MNLTGGWRAPHGGHVSAPLESSSADTQMACSRSARGVLFSTASCSRPAPKLASPASASALLRPGSSSSQQLAASARRATPTPLPSRASRGAPVAPAFCLILESHVGILLSVPWRCQMMEGLPVPVPAAADPALTARLGLS